MMLYFAIAAGLILILPLIGLFPKVRWNGNKSINNLFKLEMRSKQYYIDTNQSMLGVYSQERIEFWIRWFTILLFIFPFVLFTSYFGAMTPAVMLVGLFLGLIITRTKMYKRQLEIIGHSAEIVSASKDRFNLEEYLHEEAVRTHNSTAYKGMFDKYTLEEFKDILKSRFWIAKLLLAIHFIAIKRIKYD